jgi:hypothetical protein
MREGCRRHCCGVCGEPEWRRLTYKTAEVQTPVGIPRDRWLPDGSARVAYYCTLLDTVPRNGDISSKKSRFPEIKWAWGHHRRQKLVRHKRDWCLSTVN